MKLKYLQVLFFCFWLSSSFSQTSVVGRYENEGGNIWIKSDGTFEIVYHGDMSRTWAMGTWAIKKRKILFTFKPVYDTFTLKTKQGLIDSLFLSDDFISERFDENSPQPDNFWGLHQTDKFCPKTLQLDRGKLYIIENGKRLKKMIRIGKRSGQLMHPYFIKQENQ